MKHLFLALLCGKALLSAYPERFEIDLGQGYQEGNLDWNIAGPLIDNQVTPDVLSELKWQDLRIWNSRLALFYYEEGYRAGFEGNYGKILEGHVLDDDYGADGRKSRFSHAHASADKGEVFDYNLTLGYGLYYGGITLTPYGGWGYEAQHLKMMSPATLEYHGNNNPFNTIPIEFETKVSDLDSSYNASWQGPLAGFDLCYDYSCFHLMGSFEYHWLDFKGKAHWNLRDDIIGPFHHSGRATGTKFKAGGSFDLTHRWSLGILATFTNYHLKEGVEHSKIVFNNETVSIKTRLNDVNWNTWTLTANLGYRF